MKRKAKLLCSSLVLSLIIMVPASVRAESAVPMYEKSMKLFEQIQDLELMQRNIEECYQAEKRTAIVACWSGQSGRDHAEFNGRLMNRVFGHLAGTLEYERFMKAYRALVQRSGYRRLHTDELFAEYMRLLESGRIRLLTRLNDWQESLPEQCSAPAHEGLAQSIPFKTVTFVHAEGVQRAESVRVVPAVLLLVQMPLGDSTPLAVGGKSGSTMVVPRTDQSGSARTAAPTIDMVEVHLLVAQERVVPLEKVSMGYRHGSAKGVQSKTRTNLGFSEGFEKGVGAWDQ